MLQLSDHFTFGKLLKYTFPPIIMMVFTSIYTIVDGIFVSNFAGKEAFTAVNFIMPYLLMLGSFGFMFGTGGGALIGKLLGEKRGEDANKTFSLLVYVSAVCGVILGILGIIFLRPLAILLGAEGLLLENSILYGTIFLSGTPFLLIQYEFQNIFPTAEKPKLGLYITIGAGLTNIVLDALFVGFFGWGLAGAAVATVISQVAGGIYPIIYFARPNKSLLKLGKTQFNGKTLARICMNGSSEFMTNISSSVIGLLYNLQLMKYAGENGVAAYGAVMYICFVFNSVFFGYTVGMAPIVSYNFGAQNKDELKNVLKKSLVVISIVSVLMFFTSELLSAPLSQLFVGYDKELFEMTLRCFRIFSFTFLIAGFSIFGSAFFTALNNGLISASISFMRTLLFQVVAIFVLPLIWEIDGIWAAVVFADFAALIVTSTFLISNKKKYGY